MKVSIIIPFLNEAKNLAPLLDEIVTVMDQTNEQYEVIFVDDGSTDHSKQEIIHSPHFSSQKAVLYTHRKRFGKGNALKTGINHAQGDVLIFMDGDLQNDPKDLPHFIEKIKHGYDFVNGIRDSRTDHSLIQMYSRFANIFIRRVLQSPFTDINSAFKAMKREVLDEVVLYGNNFRFLPLAIFYRGFKVTEITIHNRPRIHGDSKFGVFKIFVGLLDTFTAYFLYRFAERPLVFFGSTGGLFFGVGFVIAIYLTIERIFFNVLLYRRPALQLAVLLIIVGIQIIMTGFIGELVVYLYNRKK